MSDSTRSVVETYFDGIAAKAPSLHGVRVPLTIWTDLPKPFWDDVCWRHMDFHSLYIVQRGRGVHVIDDLPYAVARGDVYTMRPGQKHYLSACNGLVLETIHFSPRICAATDWEITPPPAGGRWLHLTPAAHTGISEMLAELRTEWQAGTPEGALLIRGLFLRLLVRLQRLRASGIPVPEGPAGTKEETIAAALRYLDDHFAEPVRIEQVAAAVHLSPDHFSEVFAQRMGRTPGDYIRHIRLERAKMLLTGTDESIGRIGLRVGFADASYFARVFRAETGKTPRQWRQNALYNPAKP